MASHSSPPSALPARAAIIWWLPRWSSRGFAYQMIAGLTAASMKLIRIGHGPLDGGVRVIRALCKDSITARTLAGKLRALLYQAAG